MDGQFWIGFLQIFLIDLVLSGDNAVVIGMACRGLPPKERKRAIYIGSLGAILLRILLTGLTAWMLEIPLVKAIGGLLLLWIAWKLMYGEPEETTEVSPHGNIGQAIKTIILADFVMSLDNVLAVGGAADGDWLLIIIGLGLSIPLLMWGSAFVARLLNRFPSLALLGGGVLVYTAAEMILEDPYVWKVLNPLLWNHSWIPFLAAVGVVGWGRYRRAME
ncbi:TerC family protein [Brevibacillus composti]|uniref:TerC family protein n=1 Tax=Brevibacillus composti TaxID=2796470 RepID=A0A7T5EN08_9BACL|nr:TerC family protein [Brevibacillus composti]QQE75610.1 TerC family protein [Brevibacillus composti]QUO42636.1 TerC family protein [Brevibacillus composti]